MNENLQALHQIQTRAQKQGASPSRANVSTDNQKTNSNDSLKQLHEEMHTLIEKASNNTNKMD